MLCTLCKGAIFDDEVWEGNDKAHHVNAASWASSISSGCLICVTLWEGIESMIAIRQLDFSSADVKPERACGGPQYSPESTYERILNSIVVDWPLYTLSLHTRVGGRWSLHFEPGSILLDSEEPGPEELFKRFTVLPVNKSQVGPSSTGLSNSTGSDDSFSCVKTWVRDCNDRHEECRPATTGEVSREWLPTRLLHVGIRKSHSVRLVDSNEPGVHGPYTTLSHCWGDPKVFRPIQLNHDTEDSFRQFIPWDGKGGLPQTFRDAIELTRELGILYIWIDSLCILQGDTKEWLREGPKLEDVYRHSYCNLAAVDSKDGRGGLFRSRSPVAVAPSIVAADSLLFPPGHYRVVRPDLWTGEVLSEPLYRRAWVFQERMLSPRMLHFGKQQIFWQCSTITVCETAPTSFPPGVEDDPDAELVWRRALHQGRLTQAASNRQTFELDLDKIWTTCVQSYSSCALTFNGDKIIAIAGIASVMKKAFGDDYLAGLWKPSDSKYGVNANLAEQLGWQVQAGAKADGSRSTRYGRDEVDSPAPTWSWASVNGVISLRERSRLPRLYMAEVLDTRIALKDKTFEVGPVHAEDCLLKIRGQLLRLKFCKPPDLKHEWQWLPRENGKDLARLPMCRAQFDDERDAECATDGITVLAILLAYSPGVTPTEAKAYSGHGLLVKERSRQKGYFERIGSVDFKALTQEDWNQMQSEAIEPPGVMSTISLK